MYVNSVLSATSERYLVLVSTEEPAPHQAWIYLRVVQGEKALCVPLGPEQSRELAAHLTLHADRFEASQTAHRAAVDRLLQIPPKEEDASGAGNQATDFGPRTSDL